jgi:hypothetical protein
VDGEIMMSNKELDGKPAFRIIKNVLGTYIIQTKCENGWTQSDTIRISYDVESAEDEIKTAVKSEYFLLTTPKEVIKTYDHRGDVLDQELLQKFKKESQ